MQHHPDRGGDEEKFKEVNEAYQALKDPDKRRMYDQFGTTEPQQGGPGGFNFNAGPGGFDINDIMSQFGFGGFARQQMRNRDITIGVNITLAEVYTGKQILATYRLANGKEQTVDLNIPVGIRQGDRIRFSGMGQQDIQQVPPGDLYVQVNIQSNQEFEVHGLDLITSRRINVLDLITGKNIDIRTPNGNVIQLKIQKGTQPNTTLRLTGKGLPNRQGNPGSILVKILGQVPQSLEEEDIKKIEQIGRKYS